MLDIILLVFERRAGRDLVVVTRDISSLSSSRHDSADLPVQGLSAYGFF
jgi:hypothetical protein